MSRSSTFSERSVKCNLHQLNVPFSRCDLDSHSDACSCSWIITNLKESTTVLQFRVAKHKGEIMYIIFSFAHRDIEKWKRCKISSVLNSSRKVLEHAYIITPRNESQCESSQLSQKMIHFLKMVLTVISYRSSIDLSICFGSHYRLPFL